MVKGRMPTQLAEYWVHGKGAAKIRWGQPHDFDRCVRNLRKYFPRNPEGLCNRLHTRALGVPPGQEHSLTPLGLDAEFRSVSADERRRLAEEGKALPDGSFPIATVADLRNAIQAIGRASNPAAAKKLIRKRARELDAENLVPDSWSLELDVAEEFDILDGLRLDAELGEFHLRGRHNQQTHGNRVGKPGNLPGKTGIGGIVRRDLEIKGRREIEQEPAERQALKESIDRANAAKAARDAPKQRTKTPTREQQARNVAAAKGRPKDLTPKAFEGLQRVAEIVGDGEAPVPTPAKGGVNENTLFNLIKKGYIRREGSSDKPISLTEKGKRALGRDTGGGDSNGGPSIESALGQTQEERDRRARIMLGDEEAARQIAKRESGPGTAVRETKAAQYAREVKERRAAREAAERERRARTPWHFLSDDDVAKFNREQGLTSRQVRARNDARRAEIQAMSDDELDEIPFVTTNFDGREAIKEIGRRQRSEQGFNPKSKTAAPPPRLTSAQSMSAEEVREKIVAQERENLLRHSSRAVNRAKQAAIAADDANRAAQFAEYQQTLEQERRRQAHTQAGIDMPRVSSFEEADVIASPTLAAAYADVRRALEDDAYHRRLASYGEGERTPGQIAQDNLQQVIARDREDRLRELTDAYARIKEGDVDAVGAALGREPNTTAALDLERAREGNRAGPLAVEDPTPEELWLIEAAAQAQQRRSAYLALANEWDERAERTARPSTFGNAELTLQQRERAGAIEQEARRQARQFTERYQQEQRAYDDAVRKLDTMISEREERSRTALQAALTMLRSDVGEEPNLVSVRRQAAREYRSERGWPSENADKKAVPASQRYGLGARRDREAEAVIARDAVAQAAGELQYVKEAQAFYQRFVGEAERQLANPDLDREARGVLSQNLNKARILQRSSDAELASAQRKLADAERRYEEQFGSLQASAAGGVNHMHDDDIELFDVLGVSLFDPPAEYDALAAAAAAAVDDDTDDDDTDDDSEFEESFGTVKTWSGMLAPIDKRTGDGRRFSKGSLSNRDVPLPLLMQVQTGEGHKQSVVVGRINEVEHRDDGTYGRGDFLDFEKFPEAERAFELLKAGVVGPSVDLDDVTYEFRNADGSPFDEAKFVTATEAGEEPAKPEFVVTAGRVSAATLVAIPAFAEVKLELGEEPDRDGAYAAMMAELADGCDDCDALTAAAGWSAPSADMFADPALPGPTPLTIRPDGRVFGHLAEWGTCHVGFEGACVTPPSSPSNYAYFHTGEIETAEGEALPVGRLVVGTKHANLAMGFKASAQHYDDTGRVAAYVRAGEDAYGIWVSGVVVGDMSPEDRVTFSANPLSGDWRRVGGSLELVGAVSVPVPGYPVARVTAGDRQTALVAAGISPDLLRGGETQREDVYTETELRAMIRAEFNRERELEKEMAWWADATGREAAALLASLDH